MISRDSGKITFT
jgi:outer membrane protein assembly factor BamB